MRSLLVAILLVACLAPTAGCQWGSAGFVGDLGGRTFDPAGTVFSYLDGRDDNLVEDDRPRAVVFMTWLIFNPAGDLNDLEGAELEDYRHEMALRDAMAIVFDDAAVLLPGDRLESNIVDGVEESTDGVQVRLHFAPERLNAFTTYADFKPFGSERQAVVRLSTVGLEPPVSAIDGSVTITIGLSDSDPAEALTGTLEGTFSAPLVDERVAEHNLALLESEPLLGVPLDPRPVVVDEGAGE
jgi:hypothetical protein